MCLLIPWKKIRRSFKSQLLKKVTKIFIRNPCQCKQWRPKHTRKEKLSKLPQFSISSDESSLFSLSKPFPTAFLLAWHSREKKLMLFGTEISKQAASEMQKNTQFHRYIDINKSSLSTLSWHDISLSLWQKVEREEIIHH